MVAHTRTHEVNGDIFVVAHEQLFIRMRLLWHFLSGFILSTENKKYGDTFRYDTIHLDLEWIWQSKDIKIYIYIYIYTYIFIYIY